MFVGVASRWKTTRTSFVSEFHATFGLRDGLTARRGVIAAETPPTGEMVLAPISAVCGSVAVNQTLLVGDQAGAPAKVLSAIRNAVVAYEIDVEVFAVMTRPIRLYGAAAFDHVIRNWLFPFERPVRFDAPATTVGDVVMIPP